MLIAANQNRVKNTSSSRTLCRRTPPKTICSCMSNPQIRLTRLDKPPPNKGNLQLHNFHTLFEITIIMHWMQVLKEVKVKESVQSIYMLIQCARSHKHRVHLQGGVKKDLHITWEIIRYLLCSRSWIKRQWQVWGDRAPRVLERTRTRVREAEDLNLGNLNMKWIIRLKPVKFKKCSKMAQDTEMIKLNFHQIKHQIWPP